MVFNFPIIREFAGFNVPVLRIEASSLDNYSSISPSICAGKFPFSMHSWSNIFVMFIRYLIKIFRLNSDREITCLLKIVTILICHTSRGGRSIFSTVC